MAGDPKRVSHVQQTHPPAPHRRSPGCWGSNGPGGGVRELWRRKPDSLYRENTHIKHTRDDGQWSSLRHLTGNVDNDPKRPCCWPLSNMPWWELDIESTKMIWLDQSGRGWMNRTFSFKMLLVLLPHCTVHQKNMAGKGATFESRISSPPSLDD